MPLTLRPYQQEAEDAFWAHLRATITNPVIVIPTAGGKSLVMASITNTAVSKWRGRVLILAHVRELLEQNANEIREQYPHIPVGIYSASLGSRDTGYPVIVAGIQSVYKKACELGKFDVILVDEAHLIPESEDGMYTSFLADMKVINPKVRIGGLTATPYRLKSGLICSPEGFLNDICYEAGIPALIADGYLCPLRSKGADGGQLNTDGIHLRAGEFISEEVEALVNADPIVCQAVDETLKYTKNRNSVLWFCHSIAHMEHVAQVIRSRGQECDFVHGGSSLFDRSDAIERFKNFKLKHLLNVNVLTTGFNARNIDAIVMLRPTMSPGLYYQMIGRGFRTHPSKTSTLVLDFCGNVLRHGPVDALKAPKKRGQGTGPETAPAKECPKCHALIHAAVLICPECGQEFLPPAELARHEGQAGSEAVMSGEVADETKQVFGVHYKVHEKKGGNETTPRTMRVIYELDEMGIKTVSEWVCLEHEGFARNKAIKWWRERSKLPVPDDSTVAVAYARDGLAVPSSITVRTVSGEKFPSIIAYELGEIPAQPAETIEFLEKSIQRMECRRTTCPDCGGTRVSQQMDESYNRLANICAECGRWMMWAAGATEPARELPSVEVAMGVDEDCIPF
jgi:DNA repair protein RadD